MKNYKFHPYDFKIKSQLKFKQQGGINSNSKKRLNFKFKFKQKNVCNKHLIFKRTEPERDKFKQQGG